MLAHLLNGRIGEALSSNPLFFAVFLLMLLGGGGILLARSLGWSLSLKLSPRGLRRALLGSLFALLANWVYLLWRFSSAGAWLH